MRIIHKLFILSILFIFVDLKKFNQIRTFLMIIWIVTVINLLDFNFLSAVIFSGLGCGVIYCVMVIMRKFIKINDENT